MSLVLYVPLVQSMSVFPYMLALSFQILSHQDKPRVNQPYVHNFA